MRAAAIAMLMAIFVAVPLLGGCPTLGLTPTISKEALDKEPTMTEAEKNAWAAVAEAYTTITAVDRVIESNAKEGLWASKAEAQSYLAKAKDARKKVNEARLFLKAGDWSSAENQAQAIQAVLVVLQREVVRERKKESP